MTTQQPIAPEIQALLPASNVGKPANRCGGQHRRPGGVGETNSVKLDAGKLNPSGLRENIQPFQSFLSSLPGVEGAPFFSARNTRTRSPGRAMNRS